MFGGVEYLLLRHVDLYVNDWTLDLGDAGARALAELSDRAAGAGLGDGTRLAVFPAG